MGDAGTCSVRLEAHGMSDTQGLNRLEGHIAAWQKDEQEVMRRLHERGHLISDLAIYAKDVPDCDGIKAVIWLTGQDH